MACINVTICLEVHNDIELFILNFSANQEAVFEYVYKPRTS